MTRPKQEGGLGLRKFEEVQMAFRLKQVWNVLKGESLWAKVFASKFLKGKHILRCLIVVMQLILRCCYLILKKLFLILR